jgi:hypothetical protein
MMEGDGVADGIVLLFFIVIFGFAWTTAAMRTY